ncbi:hypothetical protein B0H14DRAFT_3463021 [Mycena olivaceomarginata]|nr:hypothetical protein B0H14DRAFT_3463021 [Mycena olivaceomarginata]
MTRTSSFKLSIFACLIRGPNGAKGLLEASILGNSSRAYVPRQFGLKGLLKYWNDMFFPDRNDFDNEEPTGDRLLSVRIAMRRAQSFSTRGDLPIMLHPQAGPSTPPK